MRLASEKTCTKWAVTSVQNYSEKGGDGYWAKVSSGDGK